LPDAKACVIIWRMEHTIERLGSIPYNPGMQKKSRNIDFAAICKQLRKSRGLTQKEMAIQLGSSIRAYQYWEAGEQAPSADAAFLLAQMLCEDKLEAMKQKIAEEMRRKIEELQANGGETRH
jgi:DNA-binding transcriptional regulator YiaG